MAITVTEKFESRKSTKGDNPSAELVYTVRGTNDDLAARNAAETTSPATYDGQPRQSTSVEPVGDELWEAVVRYGKAQGGSLPEPGESIFSFDTGGGTQHITQSKDTVSSHAPSGSAPPDFGGAIGVTADGVEGVDITVPVFQFSETHYFTNDQVTPSYKGTLFTLTGKVNSGAFKGFQAGEVLFLGATGSKRTQLGEDADWEITYRFAGSPNVTGLTIGPIGGTRYGSSNHGQHAYSLVQGFKPRFVVDFGCGRNLFIQHLRRLGIDGLGVDFAFPEADIVAPMHRVPLSASIADVVTAFDALEHLLPEEVDEVLDEMRRIAVPGGRFVFSICTRESKTKINGEGLHPTVRSRGWWMERIGRVGTVRQGLGAPRYIAGVFNDA